MTSRDDAPTPSVAAVHSPLEVLRSLTMARKDDPALGPQATRQREDDAG